MSSWPRPRRRRARTSTALFPSPNRWPTRRRRSASRSRRCSDRRCRPRGCCSSAIWFVYYIGNYGWLTLAPTLFTDKGYSLADSTTYLIVSGIGFLVGAYATTHFTDRLERKYSTTVFAVAWGIRCWWSGFFVSPAIIIIFGFIASTTIGLLVPMLYTYTAEHFSTNARATGVALRTGLGTSAARWRR